MKKVLVLSLLLFGACSVQSDPRTIFIKTVQNMNIYWFDHTTSTVSSKRFIMADNGEIPDPADIRTVYTIDSMINSTTAGYKFVQYYADNTSQALYVVFFVGQTSTGKRALVQGNFLRANPLPTVSITSTAPADVAIWKAYHKTVFVKDNFSITRGIVAAVEK